MDLCDALAVGAGDVVAITGGGGKTTALYRLGAELGGRGVPALLCGTTRFTPPAGSEAPNLITVETADELRRALEVATRWPVTAATGWGSKGRLLPLEPEWLDALHTARPDLVITVEADGSAMRPFKAPGEHEPVVPPAATLVVSVVGMDAVGRPLDATHVHRPERVASLTGASLGTVVTPEIVAMVLLHGEGGRKGVPHDARWAVLLNKADTEARFTAAEAVAARLRPVAGRVLIGQLTRQPPVLSARIGDRVT